MTTPFSGTVDEVPAEETYALRRAVLRPDGGDVVWAGDEDPATFHLAARTPDGHVVGVVRFSPAPCPWRAAAHPWQLRGMATDPALRGGGSGRAVLAAGLAAVSARGGDLVWCDARLSAAGFYVRTGFTVVTPEPYDKPGIGPHVGMLIELSGAGANRSS
ncbi:GNAT family N-acetyltransferase [Blastococcus haudaquaticus]|uniref:Predicted N-acyltransferase, GNAT family n=1 Tax=Blastococcus haudaquaticus TaxID=1938745 RepID=A0A286GZX1_9ACTN|nr:GNAT family N-acetyltransferase [Blastococcus haudaquaticus]SOE01088.1 Predicted N-acyltransferase, GNAT family [Blastococcus haudaquaticus]